MLLFYPLFGVPFYFCHLCGETRTVPFAREVMGNISTGNCHYIFLDLKGRDTFCWNLWSIGGTVPYFWPYFVGIFPYIGLKNRPKIYGFGTSNSGSWNGHWSIFCWDLMGYILLFSSWWEPIRRIQKTEHSGSWLEAASDILYLSIPLWIDTIVNVYKAIENGPVEIVSHEKWWIFP